MNNWTNRFKQAVLSFLTITMAITGSNTIGGAGLATAVMIASSSDAEARTVRGASRSRTRTTSRGTTHRSVSRTSTHRHTAVRPVAAPAVRSTARRTTRRTARRVTRRHVYTLPVGYAAVTYGGYRYYRSGGIYYYPYYVSGQTVYVEVPVDPNNPAPPPPVDSITEEYEVDD